MLRKTAAWFTTAVILFNLVPLQKAAAADLQFGSTIASSNGRVYAIQQDGSLWYWGKATFNNTAGDQSPKRAEKTKIMDDVISVAGDWWSGLAIKSDNSLWSIEYDEGLGATHAIKVMDGVKEAAVSYTDWLFLKTDGTVWQRKIYGNSQTPFQVMSEVEHISAGIESYYAVKDDGTLWGWGSNYSGELGVHTEDSYISTPLEIISDVNTVYGTGSKAYAVKIDGSLWGWGSNKDGLINTGKIETNQFTYSDGSKGVGKGQFTPVKLMEDVVKVDGRNHTVVIKKDHSLWAWGSNSAGQLGDGSTNTNNKPVKVQDNVLDVTAKGAFTVALKSDGGLVGFGTNAVGELAQGSFDSKPHSKPLQLMEHVAIPGTSASFPSEWAKEGIQEASQKNLLPVHLQSHYQNDITRKDFVSLIVHLIKAKTGKDLDTLIREKGLNPVQAFRDTDDKDILNITTCKIINGVDQDKFDPNGLITREQAAVILMNTAKFLGINGNAQGNADREFEDMLGISSLAIDAVEYCMIHGIMGGTGEHVFSPKSHFSIEMSVLTVLRLSNII
jgi:hypothetical protein